MKSNNSSQRSEMDSAMTNLNYTLLLTESEEWEKLAALFRTIVAYTGRYRVEDDRFITKVDASWNEAWTGTEQERFYTLDGDKLEVRTAWMPNPLVSENAMGRGVLGFRRE